MGQGIQENPNNIISDQISSDYQMDQNVNVNNNDTESDEDLDHHYKDNSSEENDKNIDVNYVDQNRVPEIQQIKEWVI